MVQNLLCAQSLSQSELTFSWELPTLLGNEVVSYQVTVNRLEHKGNTRELTQLIVCDNFTEMKRASVNGLGKSLL